MKNLEKNNNFSPIKNYSEFVKKVVAKEFIKSKSSNKKYEEKNISSKSNKNNVESEIKNTSKFKPFIKEEKIIQKNEESKKSIQESNNIKTVKSQQIFLKNEEIIQKNCINLLSNEEKQLYGDRILKNFTKLDLLGRGGFGVVWLCSSNTDKNSYYALKQIPKINFSGSEKEIIFGEFMKNNFNDITIQQKYEGIKYLINYYNHEINEKDCWIVYERGGQPLSRLLHQMKGEFIKDYSIVHSDLKPDNILISDDLKIIDFGSAFFLNGKGNLSNITPEYMPPEVLELYLNPGKLSFIEELNLISEKWSVDIWSLGVIIVEIIEGIPVWLNYKCKVTNCKGKKCSKTGIFSVKGRDYNKILEKQKEVVNNLRNILENNGITDENLIDLIEKILEINPLKRISAKNLLNHAFLNS